MSNRIYKVEITEYPDDRPNWEPDGWTEYALERWPDGEKVWVDGELVHHLVKPFFWPSTDKLYQSRSSARERAALIESWGAKTVILESDLRWRSIEDANRERAEARKQKRLDRLYAEIRKVRES